MGNWYDVRVIRKEKVFEMELNKNFNIESVTGLKNWINPQFLISLVSFEVSVPSTIDTRVEIQGVYPNYIFKNVDMNVVYGKCIVYVTEGDGSTGDNNTEISSNINWKNIGKISNNKKIVKLNKENDFSYYIGNIEAPQNQYYILPFFKKNNFPTIFKRYDFVIEKRDDNTFSLHVKYKTPILKENNYIKGEQNSTELNVSNFNGVVFVGGFINVRGSANRPTSEIILNGTPVAIRTSVESGNWEGIELPTYLCLCDKNKTYNFKGKTSIGGFNNIKWRYLKVDYDSSYEYLNSPATDEFVCLIVGV